MMPPALPRATYRLQLTPSFGFDDAAAVVPYLKALGISHVYASPFLKARAGSTHGYDIIDHNVLSPQFGGEGGFTRLCAALAEADIGLILDFVPNHMGVHFADNAWWLDVLEWGAKSSHAAAFDIDWETMPYRRQGGVLLPILGRPYGEALENGEIELRYDADEGSFSAWYYDHRLPIEPTRYGEILRKIVETAGADDEPAGRALLELAARYKGPRNPARSKSPALKQELAAIVGAPAVIERGLCAYRPRPGEPDSVLALHHLLERQHYRVAYWRLAGSEINYRRFFDVNTLAGIRVEDRGTFDAIHRLNARLIADGLLQGLRLDHIDGLRDPHQYFRRLQAITRPGGRRGRRTFYVVVEKILAEDERLPKFAGVAGTTGYEWLNVISRVLLDQRVLAPLDEVWRDVSGERRSFDEILIEAKQRVLRSLLASEFTVLVRLLTRIAVGHYSTRDYSADSLRAAFELFILHFPVYRTYLTASGPSGKDRAIIEEAIDKARRQWFGPGVHVFDFLRDVLTLDLVKPGRAGHSISRVRRFAFKVQQFTGPMMAKSLEDTAFYRYHRVLALNEVGGNPSVNAMTIGQFHERMATRAATFPHGMTATATHDTKRGEDARTRLLALPELAQAWKHAVQEWRSYNAPLIGRSKSRAIPSPAHEYMLYQALLGAWPIETPDLADSDLANSDFVERIQAYAVKAAREGKEQTSWLAPNDNYETGLRDFVQQLLDRARSAEFITSFDAFARRIACIGALKSLVQVALKITMPGVPDFYQGTELWDLSMVDPDNRKPVEFASRAAALNSVGDHPEWRTLADSWTDGRIKLALIRRLLALRRAMPAVFDDGRYHRLDVTGPHHDEVLAFARLGKRDAVIIAVVRFFGRATDDGRRWPRKGAWEGVINVENMAAFKSVLTAGPVMIEPKLTLIDLFDVLPVAVFQARLQS
jgi:(1->4)-alpha-D-glucan 1-alpha-D-glucosylmutase